MQSAWNFACRKFSTDLPSIPFKLIFQSILPQLNELKDQPELFEDAITVLMGSLDDYTDAKRIQRILTFAFEAYGELAKHFLDAQDYTKPRNENSANIFHSPDIFLNKFRKAKPPKQPFTASLLRDFKMLPKFDEHKVALAASTLDMVPAWTAYATKVEQSFKNVFQEDGKDGESFSKADAICKGLVDEALQQECRKGVKSIECEPRYALKPSSSSSLQSRVICDF